MVKNPVDSKAGFCPNCGEWLDEKDIEGECLVVNGVDLYGERTSWEEYIYKTTCKHCKCQLEGHFLHDPIRGEDKLIWKEDRQK